MNPFVEIEFREAGDSGQLLAPLFSEAKRHGRTISAVIQGFDKWTNAVKLNEEVRHQ